MKRTIKLNRWDNWYGYMAGKRVMEFGTDEAKAMLWRDNPEAFDSESADRKQWLAQTFKIKILA